MRKTLVQTCRKLCQTGEPLLLRYYLLAEEDGSLERYGTEIVLRRGVSEERCACHDVTPLSSVMLDLIGILARNSVTPALLDEILPSLL